MTILHLIGDWFEEMGIPPGRANCIWLLGFPEITFDRKNLTLIEYTSILTEGNSVFKQANHNPDNLVGYHPLESEAIQIRINNCLVRKQVYPNRATYIDPDGVWTNPNPPESLDQNMLRED